MVPPQLRRCRPQEHCLAFSRISTAPTGPATVQWRRDDPEQDLPLRILVRRRIEGN